MKQKQNIGIIVPFFSLGGAEKQAFYVAKIYKQKGFNVTVLAFENKSGYLIEQLQKYKIVHEFIPFDLNLIHHGGFKKVIELLKVALFFRRFKFDYLLPFTYYPNVVCNAIWRLSGVKKSFWNQRGLESIPINAIERIAIKMKPSYLANANVCADFIASRHGLSSSAVKIIKNGIEEPLLIEDDNFKALTQDKLVFVMVANFYPEKKHELLLSAWQKATSNDPDKLLVLVGYSPNEIFLLKAKALAYDLNITNVHFLSSSDNIPALLRVSDVGVLITEKEGCPNSVLEYMLNKMPAIVSSIPATKEIFDADYPLFCNLDNEDGLINCIQKCFDDRFRSDIGEQNYHKVLENYSLDHLADNYLALVC